MAWGRGGGGGVWGPWLGEGGGGGGLGSMAWGGGGSGHHQLEEPGRWEALGDCCEGGYRGERGREREREGERERGREREWKGRGRGGRYIYRCLHT